MEEAPYGTWSSPIDGAAVAQDRGWKQVVPPSQSDVVVNALKRNGVPHAYLAFPGEQHGFRKAESLQRAAEAELSFYAQIFGYELANPGFCIDIEQNQH